MNMSKLIEAGEYVNLLMHNPIQIARWLGFADMLDDLHGEWIKTMMLSRRDETILAHRGSFKTTCLTIAIASLMILHPSRNIIFLRKTDSDVKEVTRQVTKLLQSNVYRHIAKKIYDVDLAFTEATAFTITTNLTADNRGRSQMLGVGIGASITGKHADIVITDDIVNIKDRISKAEREYAILAYAELQNIKNRGGRILNTGTPWHKEDCISKMPNIQRFDCYTTGLISRDDIEVLRSKMSPSLFAANYELQCIADSDTLFDNPAFTKDISLIYNGVAHIDAAYGGGDGTAFTILKQHGDKLIMFGKRWDRHVDDCLREIYAYMDYYRAGRIYVEKNADKGYLSNAINKAGRYAQAYNESMNKFIKISTYLRKHWPDIYWLEDTDSEYINEILDYMENANHDDSPDSAASLIREVMGKGQWLV